MTQINEEKLNDVQKRLDDLGLSDVKIHFHRESLKKLTRNELCKHVSHVFHTYLNGERVPLELFGDSNGRGIELMEDKKTNKEQITPEQRIDEALDSVLRASGSALRHYTMQSTLDDMRKAMRRIMSDSYIAGLMMREW